ncbi:MAG: ABC transporter ATP-binding protein [Pirellulaceae bacterium]|nr:ABC transporter ATP-binding protein [Pirellulaceae bacterium]
MSGIVIRGLTRTYGKSARAIDRLDLEVREGELLAVVGPSGSGKTTLLRLVAGLEEPTEGEILLDGQSVVGVSPQRRDVALVFQSLALYEHWTVRQNLAFAARRTTNKQGDIEEAARLARIEHLLDRRPAELSGGEQQRVALGRAIVRRPKALLLDEPLSSLDLPLRRALRHELKALQRKLGVPTIYVTHDQAEALGVGDRVAVLNAGRLAQVGTPEEIYDRPGTRFVAEFFGPYGMNLIAGEWLEGKFGSEPAGVLLGIRPEDVRLLRPGASEPPTARGTVEESENLGESKYLQVKVKTTTITVRLTDRNQHYPPNTDLELYFPPDRVHRFDRQTGTRLTRND